MIILIFCSLPFLYFHLYYITKTEIIKIPSTPLEPLTWQIELILPRLSSGKPLGYLKRLAGAVPQPLINFCLRGTKKTDFLRFEQKCRSLFLVFPIFKFYYIQGEVPVMSQPIRQGVANIVFPGEWISEYIHRM